jgi:hypothetical protein
LNLKQPFQHSGRKKGLFCLTINIKNIKPGEEDTNIPFEAKGCENKNLKITGICERNSIN